jgi:hypothetical protein
MYKIILILAAILLLVLSAGLTPARPDHVLAPGDAKAGLAMLAVPVGSSEPIGRTATDLSAGSPLQRADKADGPAPALLVYIAFIALGSCLGIGMVRRNQRGL